MATAPLVALFLWMLSSLGGSLRVVAWPSTCPRPCTCGLKTGFMSQSEHKTINCDGESLTSPPLAIPNDTESLLLAVNRVQPSSLGVLADYTNLTEVNLAQNHIYGLGDVGAVIPALRYLSLDGNEIDYLGNRTFWWAPNLQVLSVRVNKIEMIDANAFSGLIHLRDLDMTENRLYVVVEGWFKDLQSLVNLNLGQNNIHNIQERAFHYLPALKALDLSHNQLQHVYDRAFLGLDSLARLSLQGNSLKVVPLTAVQRIFNLKELNLDGNMFTRLNVQAIGNMSLTHLSLSHLDHLQFIDRYSFYNMSQLSSLNISHNRRLTYMDPRSFYMTPNLKSLSIEHNNLSVIEEDLVGSLPSLRTLHFSGNSLHCDCNLWWLVDEYRDHVHSLDVTEASSVLCSEPPSLSGKTLRDLDISTIPRSCAPRIFPIFAQQQHVDLGDCVTLDCRAVGRPFPQTDWILPESATGHLAALKASTPNLTDIHRVASHITLSKAGTLTIEYVQGTDGGVYTCLATNPHGRDDRTARLHVKTDLASVIVMRVVQTSITITWRSSSFRHRYQIIYRRHRSNETYHTTSIEPYMKSFTANSLRPNTRYQFCIAMQQGGNTVRINCTIIKTTQVNKHGGVFQAKNYIIGGAVSAFVLLVVVGYAAAYFVQRYNRRKREEEELYSDNLSQLFLASMDSMSDTTPITYENRGAEMFDEDDIEEIRNTASMPSCSNVQHTTVIT